MDRNEQKNNFQNVQNRRRREHRKGGVGGILTIIAVVILAVYISVVYYQASTAYERLDGRVFKLEHRVKELEAALTPAPEAETVPEAEAAPEAEASPEPQTDQTEDDGVENDQDSGSSDESDNENLQE